MSDREWMRKAAQALAEEWGEEVLILPPGWPFMGGQRKTLHCVLASLAITWEKKSALEIVKPFWRTEP